MELDELYAMVEDIDLSNKDANVEDLQTVIAVLYQIIKKQNDIIYEFRNSYIRVENNLKMLEEKIQQYTAYKKLCETILDRINHNPISALWFLYSVKRKIAEFNKGLN